MKKILPLLLFTAILCQCNSKQASEKERKQTQPGDRAGIDESILDLKNKTDFIQLISQRWDNKEDYDDVMASGSSGTLEIPLRGFYFFKDGKMLKNPREKMETGTWSFDSKTKMLQVKLDNGKTEDYKLGLLSFEEMLLQKIGEAKPVRYRADGLVQKNLPDDPFYIPNIQWCLKPKTAEDDQAIHKRIKDCLHFYYLYYNDNDKRNAAEISFVGLPSCFKWYAGGIHLKQEEKLDKQWKNIFYNDADASKGYALLDKMISKKYDWKQDSTNWVRQNASVIKQMEKKIDSL